MVVAGSLVVEVVAVDIQQHSGMLAVGMMAVNKQTLLDEQEDLLVVVVQGVAVHSYWYHCMYFCLQPMTVLTVILLVT